MRPIQIVEAVLFASDAPLRSDEIARADESLDEDVVEEALQDLKQLYLESERAFDLVEVAGGYQILTRPEFAGYLERFDTVPRPSRLSGPALETLAIIAYRQPLGRLEVEHIRGVGASGVIRTLQDRGLVEVVGRSDGLGRPLLYGTTSRFDLPRPEELPVILRDRTLPILPEDEEGEETEGKGIEDKGIEGEDKEGEDKRGEDREGEEREDQGQESQGPGDPVG